MTNHNAHMAMTCPVHTIRTVSKTAQMAAQMVKPEPGSRLVERFSYIRQILRSDSVNQSGVEVSPVEQDDPIRASIFLLDGEAYRQRRAAIVRFFTPKAITARHLPVMQKHTDALIAAFRGKGRGKIDDMSLHLSVAVVAEIVGLTNSNLKGMMRRVVASSRATMAERGGIWKIIARLLSLHIRAANLDADEVGPNPEMLDLDRAKKLRVNGAYMRFGDGDHFCPGWQVALSETRVFLDRLLRAPDIHWVPPMLQSYELRNVIIECDCA